MKVIFPDDQLSYLKTARPRGVMNNYVDFYFEVFLKSSKENIVWHTSLPALNELICINLDGPGWGYLNNENRKQIINGSMFIGHTVDIRQNMHYSGMHNFFISLKPGFASKLLKYHNTDLHNTSIDLDYLIRDQFLEERMCEQNSFDERIELFIELFLPIFENIDLDHKYIIVQKGLRLFKCGVNEYKNIEAISKELAVSYPTLHRHFKEVTHYSPSFCQKLIKFKTGLKAYKTEGYNFDHQRYGFTDFSHFVKTSRQLTGLKPSKL